MSDKNIVDGDNVTKIPAHILKNLKGYDEHLELTCMECGYVGAMGVKSKIVPWYVSNKMIVAAVCVLLILTFLGANFGTAITIIWGALIVMARSIFIKNIVSCPSCGEDLMTK